MALKKFAKDRYDYLMLQLYLHQLIKAHLQGQLQTRLPSS